MESLVRDLDFSLDLRKHLSDLSAPRGRSLTEDGASYRIWSEQAKQLCSKSERILAEKRYAPHLDRIENAREDIERDRERLVEALKTDAVWSELAPKLGRYDLRAPELRKITAEARQLLERPELDPGARARLERHVGIHDAARQRGERRDIGGGITP